MTKYPYRTHRRDRSACPERSRSACPERSRRACPERSRRACPERSRREAGTLAGRSGRFRRHRGDRRTKRFFGTPFPVARRCCGPATAPAQVVVAENALPRQRCLVIPSRMRKARYIRRLQHVQFHTQCPAFASRTQTKYPASVSVQMVLRAARLLVLLMPMRLTRQECRLLCPEGAASMLTKRPPNNISPWDLG
jgi:hypothetical protein